MNDKTEGTLYNDTAVIRRWPLSCRMHVTACCIASFCWRLCTDSMSFSETLILSATHEVKNQREKCSGHSSVCICCSWYSPSCAMCLLLLQSFCTADRCLSVLCSSVARRVDVDLYAAMVVLISAAMWQLLASVYTCQPLSSCAMLHCSNSFYYVCTRFDFWSAAGVKLCVFKSCWGRCQILRYFLRVR